MAKLSACGGRRSLTNGQPERPGRQSKRAYITEVGIQLGKSSVCGLFIYARGKGNRIWAFKRIYVILPPYQTLAQVRAYHNALLAKSSQQPPAPPLDSPPLPEPPDDPLQKALPTPEVVNLPLTQEDAFLPDDIQLLPQDGTSEY